MTLTDRQQKFLVFVKQKHEGQVRKYTGEPYYTHLLSVAETVSKVLPDYTLAVEIALGHDLLEDTDCTSLDLYRKLRSIGYGSTESAVISTGVVALTDVYIKDDYPDLNRKARKQLEAQRLGKIDFVAQTIKYADLLDNGSSIGQHDPGFAKVYLQEKADILAVMDKGDKGLFELCKKQLL